MDISENEASVYSKETSTPPLSLFLAPRPRRLRKAGGPGTQLEFRSSFTARGSWKFGFFLQTLPNALLTLQEILPNVSKTQRLLVEQTGGKFAD